MGGKVYKVKLRRERLYIKQKQKMGNETGKE